MVSEATASDVGADMRTDMSARRQPQEMMRIYSYAVRAASNLRIRLPIRLGPPASCCEGGGQVLGSSPVFQN
jgi:hypothetical protein